jgi:hypothetical protein
VGPFVEGGNCTTAPTLLARTEAFLKDTNSNKINLGVVSVDMCAAWLHYCGHADACEHACLLSAAHDPWASTSDACPEKCLPPFAQLLEPACQLMQGAHCEHHVATMNNMPTPDSHVLLLSACQSTQGAYRDDNSKPVVLECVREAERRIAGVFGCVGGSVVV